jgi:hypothetical protein
MKSVEFWNITRYNPWKFRRNILPPPSGSKKHPRKKYPARSRRQEGDTLHGIQKLVSNCKAFIIMRLFEFL